MAESSEILSGSGESWIGRGSQALQRGIGVWGATGVGIACIGLTSSGMLPFSLMAGMWPGGNLVYTILVGLAICLILGYIYAVITTAAPRAGADYYLASRVLSRPVAFLGSWIFVVFSSLLVGALLGAFIKDIMPVFNQIAVMLFGVSGSADLVKLANQPQVLVVAGTLITTLAFVGVFVPQRTLMRILGAGFLLGLAAWAVILLTFSASSSVAYQTAWNQVHGADSFVQVIPSAEKLGFQLVNDPAGFVFPGLAIGIWLFFGFLGTYSLAGEVRKPESSILGGGWLALLAAAAVFCGSVMIVQQVIPSDWLAAESFLSQTPGFSGVANPSVTAYAGVLISSAPLMLLIFWGWVLSFITLIQAFIIFISRILLAWAEDGLLPVGMAYVHPRFRSPLVTMLTAAILVQLGFVVAQAGGFKLGLANVNFFVSLSLLPPVTAVTFLPFLRKSWFDSSPSFVRRKIGPLPVITLLGLVSLAYLILLLVGPWVVPGWVKPVQLNDLLIFGLMLVVGLAWYWIRRSSLRLKSHRLEDDLKGSTRLV